MTRRVQDAIKRAVDIGASGVGLIITSPLMAATAVAVAASMGRPLLFRQERPGLNEEVFALVKFRSMREPAPGSNSDEDRLTRIGRFIRATSLDELPSMWNVLKGDMSLVGPRPLRTHYLGLYSSRHRKRHEVRPGVTGLAQVNGRNTLSWSDRFDLDVEYVENRSFGLDLKIIFRTIITTLDRRGISAEGHATMPAFTGYEDSEQTHAH